MAIRIKARHNESAGQMLRRFKKLCEKEGLTKDVKRKQYFEKPSERKRRAQRKTVARVQRTQHHQRDLCFTCYGFFIPLAPSATDLSLPATELVKRPVRDFCGFLLVK